jgi:hypothetical protein
MTLLLVSLKIGHVLVSVGNRSGIKIMSNKSKIIHVALWPHYKLAFAIMDAGM